MSRRKVVLLAAAAVLGLRRWLNKQSHSERVAWMALKIVQTFTYGALVTFVRRLSRGKPFHEHWSVQREVIYGGARYVMYWAQDLFEHDRKSYDAWTTLLESSSVIPMKLRLMLEGSLSHWFRAEGIPCVALCRHSHGMELIRKASTENLRMHDLKDMTILLHFHGGGLVSGGIVSAQMLGLDILNECAQDPNLHDLVIIHVDYTLATKAPFPKALQDAVSVFDWLVERGADPKKVFVCGESGGGNVAAGMLLAMRDHPEFLKSRQSSQVAAGAILISPMLYCGHDLEKYCPTLESYDIIQGKLAVGCAKTYVDCPKEALNPYASPCEATMLNDLPPILLQTGSHEIFDPFCKKFASKAKEHGTNILYEPYEGMTHCFQMAVSTGCEPSKAAFNSFRAFLKEYRA